MKEKNISYKVKPVYHKNDESKRIIAVKVKKDRLEEDFDGYYDTISEKFGGPIKIEEYDEDTAILYKRNNS